MGRNKKGTRHLSLLSSKMKSLFEESDSDEDFLGFPDVCSNPAVQTEKSNRVQEKAVSGTLGIANIYNRPRISYRRSEGNYKSLCPDNHGWGSNAPSRGLHRQKGRKSVLERKWTQSTLSDVDGSLLLHRGEITSLPAPKRATRLSLKVKPFSSLSHSPPRSRYSTPPPSSDSTCSPARPKTKIHNIVLDNLYDRPKVCYRESLGRKGQHQLYMTSEARENKLLHMRALSTTCGKQTFAKTSKVAPTKLNIAIHESDPAGALQSCVMQKQSLGEIVETDTQPLSNDTSSALAAVCPKPPPLKSRIEDLMASCSGVRSELAGFAAVLMLSGEQFSSSFQTQVDNRMGPLSPVELGHSDQQSLETAPSLDVQQAACSHFRTDGNPSQSCTDAGASSRLSSSWSAVSSPGSVKTPTNSTDDGTGRRESSIINKSEIKSTKKQSDSFTFLCASLLNSSGLSPRDFVMTDSSIVPEHMHTSQVVLKSRGRPAQPDSHDVEGASPVGATECELSSVPAPAHPNFSPSEATISPKAVSRRFSKRYRRSALDSEFIYPIAKRTRLQSSPDLGSSAQFYESKNLLSHRFETRSNRTSVGRNQQEAHSSPCHPSRAAPRTDPQLSQEQMTSPSRSGSVRARKRKVRVLPKQSAICMVLPTGVVGSSAPIMHHSHTTSPNLKFSKAKVATMSAAGPHVISSRVAKEVSRATVTPRGNVSASIHLPRLSLGESSLSSSVLSSTVHLSVGLQSTSLNRYVPAQRRKLSLRQSTRTEMSYVGPVSGLALNNDLSCTANVALKVGEGRSAGTQIDQYHIFLGPEMENSQEPLVDIVSKTMCSALSLNSNDQHVQTPARSPASSTSYRGSPSPESKCSEDSPFRVNTENTTKQHLSALGSSPLAVSGLLGNEIGPALLDGCGHGGTGAGQLPVMLGLRERVCVAPAAHRTSEYHPGSNLESQGFGSGLLHVGSINNIPVNGTNDTATGTSRWITPCGQHAKKAAIAPARMDVCTNRVFSSDLMTYGVKGVPTDVAGRTLDSGPSRLGSPFDCDADADRMVGRSALADMLFSMLGREQLACQVEGFTHKPVHVLATVDQHSSETTAHCLPRRSRFLPISGIHGGSLLSMSSATPSLEVQYDLNQEHKKDSTAGALSTRNKVSDCHTDDTNSHCIPAPTDLVSDGYVLVCESSYHGRECPQGSTWSLSRDSTVRSLPGSTEDPDLLTYGAVEKTNNFQVISRTSVQSGSAGGDLTGGVEDVVSHSERSACSLRLGAQKEVKNGRSLKRQKSPIHPKVPGITTSSRNKTSEEEKTNTRKSPRGRPQKNSKLKSKDRRHARRSPFSKKNLQTNQRSPPAKSSVKKGPGSAVEVATLGCTSTQLKTSTDGSSAPCMTTTDCSLPVENQPQASPSALVVSSTCLPFAQCASGKVFDQAPKISFQKLMLPSERSCLYPNQESYTMTLMRAVDSALLVLCRLCGSGGDPTHFVICSVCAEVAHEHCCPGLVLKNSEYVCSGCRTCKVCGRGADLVSCTSCASCFHVDCAGPAYRFTPAGHKTPWRCPACIRCKSCGSCLDRGSLTGAGLAICSSCRPLWEQGNYCPLCDGVYRDDDHTVPMIQCSKCDRWVHSRCESLTYDEYECVSELPESIPFLCKLCYTDRRKRPAYLSKVRDEIQGGFEVVYFEMLASKAFRSLQSFEMDPSALDQFRQFFRGIDSCLYLDVDHFLKDLAALFMEVTSPAPEELANLAREGLVKVVCKHIPRVFPWHEMDSTSAQLRCLLSHQPEIRNGSSVPLSIPRTADINGDHSYCLKSKPDTVVSDLHLSRFSLPSTLKDSRVCCLCASVSDKHPEAGPLLYAGYEDWVHVNCAKWSAEVTEDENGVLFNVHTALSRGKLMKCDSCGRSGATVGCYEPKCPRNYHFPCARSSGASFYADKAVSCRSHSLSKERLKEDFQVSHRTTVDLSKLRLMKKYSKSVDISSLSILSGNLVVHQLGQLTECSVYGDILVPVGYRSTRLFWSHRDPYRLSTYFLRVTEEEADVEPSLPTSLCTPSVPTSMKVEMSTTKDLADLDDSRESMALVLANLSWGIHPHPSRSYGESYHDGAANVCGPPNGIEKVPSLGRAERHRQPVANLNSNNHQRKILRFTLSSSDGFYSSHVDLEECWQELVLEINRTRDSCSLSYIPPSSISPCKFFGFTQEQVVLLVEHLHGIEKCLRYKTKHIKSTALSEAEIVLENPTGCARSEGYSGRRKWRDPFAWLASPYRWVPEVDPAFLPLIHGAGFSPQLSMLQDVHDAMRYRQLRIMVKNTVGVYRSAIDGRGLFAKKNIEANEMIIEYTGLLVRSVLVEKREKQYESKGLGYYMFRVDLDDVVDATCAGNAARFINHSCEPNCYSKIITVDGRKKIVIWAGRRIFAGEELTYDYKFPVEEDKMPCTCGSRRCRKFLN